MDAETLDRLLMDRALGVLNADVEALLAAYLEVMPTAAIRAQEFQEAANAARRVLRSEPLPSLPQLPVLRLEQIERTRRRLRGLRQIALAAAVLILGIGIGLGWPRTEKHPAAIGAPTRVAIAELPGPAQPAGGGFWSATRLYERARRRDVRSETRLIWDSAVARPQLGGAL